MSKTTFKRGQIERQRLVANNRFAQQEREAQLNRERDLWQKERKKIREDRARQQAENNQKMKERTDQWWKDRTELREQGMPAIGTEIKSLPHTTGWVHKGEGCEFVRILITQDPPGLYMDYYKPFWFISGTSIRTGAIVFLTNWKPGRDVHRIKIVKHAKSGKACIAEIID